MLNYKLVRDKIPEIIKEDKGQVIVHSASEMEYEVALYDKLREEVEEFIGEQSREELADIMEVIHAIIKHKGYKFEDILRIKKEKAEKRGAFKNKYIALMK